MFHFLLEEDRKAVEERLWVFCKGSLVLSQWNVHFDPRMSTLAKRHLWVILPSFPLFCCNINAFTVVANSTGNFIYIEDSHLLESDRIFPKVLVDMDMEYWLPKSLEVVWEGGTFTQNLDYSKVPFHFQQCRGIGHSKVFYYAQRRDCFCGLKL